MSDSAWPDLDFAGWAGTKKTLHLYAQMLGKLRIALSPHQPNWMFTSLAIVARGITTGPMPWNAGAVQATIDVFDSTMTIESSDGRRVCVELGAARSIADVFADLRAALHELGVTAAITTIPQEVVDVTPLDTDRRAVVYDVDAVLRWFRAVTAIAGVFDDWRSHFFGRTGIQLWWGAFDIALLLFSGKHVPPPPDRGYLMRYDLDAEMMNVGFYPGDEANPRALFYGYIYPQPERCGTLAVQPPATFWSEQLGEWVLPYDAVRGESDPAQTLRSFLDSVYGVCGSASGWDQAALTYTRPPTAAMNAARRAGPARVRKARETDDR